MVAALIVGALVCAYIAYMAVQGANAFDWINTNVVDSKATPPSSGPPYFQNKDTKSDNLIDGAKTSKEEQYGSVAGAIVVGLSLLGLAYMEGRS